jgi:hypothetical protein
MHEMVCSQRAKFLATTKRPSDNSLVVFRLAAVFLGNSQSLEFVWLEFRHECGQGCAVVPKLEDHLAGTCTVFDLDAKKRNGTKLDYRLRIWGRDSSSRSSTPKHRETEVDEVLQGQRRRQWRGPLVIRKCTDNDDNTWSYDDLVSEDIQLLAKYYLEHGGRMELLTVYRIKNPVPAISSQGSFAVRISCSGDVALLGKAKLNAVGIDEGESLHERFLSNISVLLGFPLCLRKLAAAPHWYSKRATVLMGDGDLPLFNIMAQKLMTCIDPKDGKTWGFSDTEYWGLPGPVVVNHVDCKPLYTYHFAVLIEFIDEILTPPMMITAEIDEAVDRMRYIDYVKARDLRHGYDDNVVKKRRWIIKKMICREKFEKYFEKY